MSTVTADRMLRAIASERRLQILEWLRSPTEHFSPQVDGDLVRDGVCGVSIAQKLEQLGAEVEGNDAIRVLVIEGEGRAFSAGGDLQTIGAAAANDTIAPVVGELLKHYHAFIETVRRMPKIVLSSVHGSAAGAGADSGGAAGAGCWLWFQATNASTATASTQPITIPRNDILRSSSREIR